MEYRKLIKFETTRLFFPYLNNGGKEQSWEGDLVYLNENGNSEILLSATNGVEQR